MYCCFGLFTSVGCASHSFFGNLNNISVSPCFFFKPVKFRIWSEISILCDIEGITISIQHSFIECSKLPAVATLYRLFNEVISRYCKKTHTIFFETIYFVRFHITTIIFCFKSWIWILSELVRLLMFRLLKYLKIILVNFGLCWICVLSERKKRTKFIWIESALKSIWKFRSWMCQFTSF